MEDALEIVPLTRERWADLEALFGPQGAYSGCWCMFWRQSSREFQEGAGAPNREAFRALVGDGRPTGVLAYAGGKPVGWCAVAPREDYPRLERSPLLRRVDDRPVWSIVCLYVLKTFRGRGLSAELLKGASAYARACGAGVVEGYPTEPHGRASGASVYMGTASAFRKAGFCEVHRPKPGRVVMRSEGDSTP